MALEQCHYPNEAYICNYVLLLDSLINNKDDVDLLVEEGIIVYSLGNNEAVADMVKNLAMKLWKKIPITMMLLKILTSATAIGGIKIWHP